VGIESEKVGCCGNSNKRRKENLTHHIDIEHGKVGGVRKGTEKQTPRQVEGWTGRTVQCPSNLA
jgi:hypothetical protein